jgi:glutamate racemase
VKPIGVFDSGVGGLTVVRALRAQLPGEAILYLGDTARLPYGTKSAATVRQYTRRNLEFLIARGVKAVVVACNTASALATSEDLQAAVPVWGVVEPGAERAAAISRGRVGVIATESTVRSDAYGQALRRCRPDLEVWSQACPLFVPLVEEGWQDDPVAEQVARRYLQPLVAAEIDTLVLGCTHYPLLAAVIRRIVGSGVELVDSAAAAAAATARGLSLAGLAEAWSASSPPLEHHFCVTDSGERFARIARQILGDEQVSLELVDVG